MQIYNPDEKYTPLIVLDCEASGLSRGSYPIEVGYTLPAGDVISYLIKPEPEWTHWDEEAQKIHNIPREQLFVDGLPAYEVAQRLNSQLAGETVYSDAPDYELMWLTTLFTSVQTEMLFDVGDLFGTFIQGQNKYFWNEKKKLRATVTAHRAGDDAWVLQNAALRSRNQAIEKFHK